MYNVVIVEDEQIIRKHYSNIINWNELGFSVSALCKNGKEALDFINNNKVDCIISDIKMSNVNGIELLKSVKEKNPEISVVLISAYSNFEFAQNAIRYNADGYLLKPLKPEELKQKMIKIKQELDHTNKIQTVISNYQRNFLNSVINHEIPLTAENFNETMEEHNIKINLKTQIAIISIRTKSKIFSDDISNQEKEQFYIFLQNIINKSFETANGFILSCKEDTLKYLLYLAENVSDFNLIVMKHISELENLLSHHNNISFDDVTLNFADEAEKLIEPSKDDFESEYQSKTANAPFKVNDIKEYIEKNIQEDLSLEKISSRFFFSPSYFSRKFKNTFGIGYIEFLIKLRMEKASELLSTTDIKIYHIGNMVGYKDTKFFTKTFKNFYGISPKEYRNKHLNRN